MALSLWILSDKGVSASTQRLLEVASARGHTATCVSPADVCFTLGSTEAPVLDSVPDVALARMGGGTPRAAFDVLFALEALAVPVVSPAAALLVARDKALSALALRAHGVPTPLSAWVAPSHVDDALRVVPGPPFVLKVPAGHQGKGVSLVHSLGALRDEARELAALAPRILVQEYLPAGSRDLRIVVVGGEAVAAMQRTASAGDFRTNLHVRGSAAAVTPSVDLSTLAVRAAAALGLDVAGVDIVETASGPTVLEVNASPGLMGITSATGVDVADSILAAVEARARGLRSPPTDEVDERDGVRA